MKLTIKKTELITALDAVTKAIGNSTMEIMQAVLIEAEKSTVRLTGTNGKLLIKSTCSAMVFEEGKTCVSAKLFYEMAKKLPVEEVEIEKKDRALGIKCGKFKSQIVCLAADTYPESEDFEGEEIKLKKAEFNDMINSVIYAVSSDESRGVLTGVNLKFSDNKLRVAAIDGFRMSTNEKKSEEKYTDKDLTVPSNALKNVVKIAKSIDSESIKIKIGSKDLRFYLGNTEIKTVLLDKEFPSVENFFQLEYKGKLTLNRKEVLGVLDRASIFKVNGMPATIKLDLDGEILKVDAKSETGTFSEELAVKFSGENKENLFPIGLNPIYLTEAVNSHKDAEEITIKMVGKVNPCIIENSEDGEGGEDGNDELKSLILPVRLAN